MQSADKHRVALRLDAKRILASKVGGRPVSCRDFHLDGSDHPTTTRAASSGDDLSAAMVRSGYALAVGPNTWRKKRQRVLRAQACGQVRFKRRGNGGRNNLMRWTNKLI